MPGTICGLEAFAAEHYQLYQGQALGLLCNQASVGQGYAHALDILDRVLPGGVVAIFSPQHGWAGEKQDNMVESPHGRTRDGRPVYSLYGQNRRPDPYMLEGLDALLVDLPDMGTRVYTFFQTLTYAMEEAGKQELPVIILDRPNPIGGHLLEGNLLDEDCRSFVGLYPIPMRHGLTLGELAHLALEGIDPAPPLSVVKASNWKREEYYPQTGLNWVMPSPNMPTPETAWLYPGQVIFEGTNLSEGRGTTKPFHLVGAPYIDQDLLAADLSELKLPGVVLRPIRFQPSYHKWAGEICGGVEVHPLNDSYRPYLTALSILEMVLRRNFKNFRLKEPPYEYDFFRRPIDLILGRKSLFDSLAKGISAKILCHSFKEEENSFLEKRQRWLLYE
jgi:uncharacterized protein YbbC (DUF1343 family)